MMRLRKFSEQLEFNKGKCNIIFKVKSTSIYTMDHIMTKNAMQKKINVFYVYKVYL